MNKEPHDHIDTNNFFDAIFERSRQNACIIMDLDGFILHVNKVFTQFFGYHEEDLVNRHTRVFFTEGDKKKKLPEREILNVSKQGHSSDNNYVVHKNGSWMWVTGESILVEREKDSVIVKMIQNIHEQKQLENFLHDSNEFVESILNQIQDFVIVVNDEMKILKANKSFLHYCNINSGRIEGSYLPDLLRTTNPAELLKLLQDTLSQKDVPVNVEIEIGDNNRVFEISSSLIERYLPGEKRILLTLNEITHEKKASRQREDIIGLVSHELRNPLSNIQMFTELLERSFDNNDKAQGKLYLQKIRSNLTRLTNLTRDMYEETQVTAGQMSLHKTSVHCEEVIKEVVETMAIMHPDYIITIKGTLDEVVHVDKYRMMQVLSNYISNAIKYTSDKNEIIVSLEKVNDEVMVKVTDYGIGIPADKIPYIFNRYYRANHSAKVNGVGLGLYLSREIVRAHGGKVWVESNEGEGSSFYFSIPFVKQ